MISYRYFVCLFCLVGFVSFFCSFVIAGEASRPSKQSTVRVRLGIPTAATDFLPFFVAKEKQFYKDEGLDVEIVYIGTSQAISAVLAGELHFNGNLNSTIRTAVQGRPVRAILALNRTPGYWLFSRPDINSMNELAGQTVAAGNPGSSTHTFTVFILEHFGLANKVRVLPSGRGSRDAALALLSGNVAAAYANSDTNIQLSDKGFRKLINYADYIKVPTSGLGTSQNMIETRPQIVQAFVNATYRGMRFVKGNRAEVIHFMAKFQKRDERSAARVYDLDVESFGGDGTVNCQQIEKGFELQKSFIGIDASAASPCDRVINNAFAHAIPKELKR
jgi:NitT/TauT family transport system substrate-binding protein